MKTINKYIQEAISYSDYKKFLNDFKFELSGEILKDKDKARIDEYKNAFWNVLKEQPDVKVSRNGHRIYIPFNQPVTLSQNIKQITQYDEEAMPIELAVRSYVVSNLPDEPKRWDYKQGTFSTEIDTKQGKKLKEYKIGKFIAKNKDLLNAFASDPFRSTKNIEDAEKYIVISDHAYDIAGMSTGRNWTSCMNILNGCNKQYVANDIVHGTFVAYLILKDDMNIEKPLGRILIKPYELIRKGYAGLSRRPIVYSPEPTVYSSYVGLENVVEYLNKLCENNT